LEQTGWQTGAMPGNETEGIGGRILKRKKSRQLAVASRREGEFYAERNQCGI